MAGRPASPRQQQQSIANDHIPLAFLLGSRAKHYVSNKATRNESNTKRGSSISSPPPAKNSSSSSARLALSTSQQQKNVVELFAPERHLREREEEARRVLRQALLFQNADTTKNCYSNSGGDCMNSSSSVPSTATTLSPVGVLKANKEQVLHQVLELRQFEQQEPRNGGGDGYAEPNYRGRGGNPIDEVENNNDARIKSFHGYQRADQQVSFLDVAGRATRIPILSNLEAKALHRSVLKKQGEWRATRVDEMHAFLQSQQQLTKQQLQLASISKDPKVSRHLARVDLGIDDYEGTGDGDNLPVSHPEAHVGALPNANSLAEVREHHQREQLLLHKRIQEKKQLEQLTRQQKLAFHQQQKREFGRVKGVKRPSFLATLQLDSNSTAGVDATKAGGAGARVFEDHQSFVSEELRQKKKMMNQEENDHDHESEGRLKQLQRDKFLQSEGGLHFGGGFKSKQKKVAAITADSASLSHSGSGIEVTTNATPSHGLLMLLECGVAATTTRHSKVTSAGRKRAA